MLSCFYSLNTFPLLANVFSSLNFGNLTSTQAFISYLIGCNCGDNSKLKLVIYLP